MLEQIAYSGQINLKLYVCEQKFDENNCFALDFYKTTDLHFGDIKLDFPMYMVEKLHNYQVNK